MARVLITGSSSGLGLLAGQLLVEQRHEVVLHARDDQRAAETRAALPEAAAVLVGDVSTLAAMQNLADQANAHDRFDAVIHNVGLGHRVPGRATTADGLSLLWAVNVLAPYVMTALVERPDRLVYLTSGLHSGGSPSLDDPQWADRRWNSGQAYSDSKLHDVLLAFGVARRWPEVFSNAVNPGWVATRMGGPSAPDDPDQGRRTQAWLAVAEDPAARTTGRYFFHQQPFDAAPAANDTALQDRLLDYCAQRSGIPLP